MKTGITPGDGIRNYEGGRRPKVGFMTPWNQACGLATYASFLASHLEKTDLVILAEQTEQHTKADGDNVIRCWKRVESGQVGDYTLLERTITQARISVLHINCQVRFFAMESFVPFLKRLRADGLKIVLQVHNLFTADPACRELMSNVDSVFVHTPENRLEAIANGAAPSAVEVVPHGVVVTPPVQEGDKVALRRALGVPLDGALLTTFGFIQPHKGIEAVIEAVLHLMQRSLPARAVVIGEVRQDDPNSAMYLAKLQELARTVGLEDRVHFVSHFVSDEAVREYLAASDIVVMNYRSQHFEASGACALALGSGSLVMTSLAPAMMGFGDAVWHMTAGYGPGLSAELLLTHSALREEIQRAAHTYCARHAWSEIGKQVLELYEKLESKQCCESVRGGDRETEMKIMKAQEGNTRNSLRVLMQNRFNTFIHRGGDTVVIEKLRDGLIARGCEVVVDTDLTEDPRKFDIVHLFNCVTVEATEKAARHAQAAGVPYVVTPLYEDISRFRTQSQACAALLMDYQQGGQRVGSWHHDMFDVMRIAPAPRLACDWILANAAMIFPNGAGEARALKRDFPALCNVKEVKFGHEIDGRGDADLFERTYGMRDFVLCVGRIESRKNQLMLLKALEDCELPLVLVGGGVNYQPDYDAVARSWQRKGKTLVVDRLSPEMLASAYAACRVHVLASWYELPGLVSLEAAAYGKNIVVTRTGTTADYVGDSAFYCQPCDPDSIHAAVMAAYHSPAKPGISALAKSFSWERTIDETLAGYMAVLGSLAVRPQTIPSTVNAGAPVYDLSSNVSEFQDALEAGELAAKEMDWEKADRLLEKAASIEPTSPRVLRAQATVLLAQSRIEEARGLFDKAIASGIRDEKILAGRGMCEVMAGDPRAAIPFLLASLQVNPAYLLALHQLVDCAYRLGSFEEVEKALQAYVIQRPDDCEMRFCLAGTQYKLGELESARQHTDVILRAQPNHQGSLELRSVIDKEMSERAGTTTVSEQSVAATDQEIRRIPLGQELRSSLEELSVKISEWKVRKDDTRPENVGTGSPSASPIVPKPTNEQEAPEEPNAYLDSKLNSVDDLKRDRKLPEAREILSSIKNATGFSRLQRVRYDCLEAEFLVLDGDLRGAEAMYDQVLQREPGAARALCGKGALAAERQEWLGAREYFATALESQPGYDVGLAGLGLCAMVGNNAEEAFQLFSEAVSRNPENTRALLGVMQVGYPLQRFAEIEKHLLAYLELHPASVDMLYSLAGVLFAQGKVREARLEVEKVLLFEPRNSRAIELKGMIEKKALGIEVTSTGLGHTTVQ